MAMNKNRLEIIGNVGRDPELRTTQGGKAVCSFAVAVNEGKDEHKTTTWFNVTAWERLAEFCSKYVKKGAAVEVAGRVFLNEYETKDGQKRSSLSVTANSILLLDKKEVSTDGGSAGPVEDDDIPF